MACKYKIRKQEFNTKEDLKQFISQRNNISDNMLNAVGIKPIARISSHQYSTEQWLGLAMRRVYQMAVQEGFDRVALITGEQSADRYDLSKQVEKIDVSQQFEDGKAVVIFMQNNYEVSLTVDNKGKVLKSADNMHGNLVPVGSELENVVGKEIAKDILEGKEEKTINNKDLKVGGEGMKTFYNSILPKVAKKEAQRFDKKAKIDVITGITPELNISINDPLNQRIRDMVENNDQYIKEFGRAASYFLIESTKDVPDVVKMINKDLKLEGISISLKKDLEKLKEDILNSTSNTSRQLSIKLTPKLKEQNQGATPLFSIKEAKAEDIQLEYNERGQHLAPNGNPSNLTVEQAKMVRTPAFIRWFGDWMNNSESASKVVDENGEPMVVYHGSSSPDISVFDRSKSTRERSGLKELGTYFTTNKKLAVLYANAKRSSEAEADLKAKIDILYEKLLKTRSNQAWDAIQAEIDKLSVKGRVYPLFLNLRTVKEFDAEGGTNIGAWNKLKAQASYKEAQNRDAMEFLKDGLFGVEKVDGVRANNIIDMSTGSSERTGYRYEKAKRDYGGDVFLVFEGGENKIKSATENNGDFSPSENIYYKIESDGITYDSFEDALRNTKGKTINIISNGKVIAKLPATLDERTTEGVINAFIFDGVIKPEKVTYNGEIFYTATGNTPQQQRYTLEFFKEEIAASLSKRDYEVKEGLIKIKEVEMIPSKEGSVHRIISDAILNNSSQKTVISKKEKISERNLRLNLFSILNDMGISTLSLKNYQDNFKLKNKLSPSVEALADIANRLVAFKGVQLEDGSIDPNSINLEDLTEEVMHIIVETMTEEQLAELSDFIKNSPEYQEHYEVYNEAYKGDQKKLEKEILGKIMKNLTLSKTEGHPKSFLAKLVDIIEQFFDKLNITSKHFRQLKELNNTVEKFVIQREDTFSESDIQESKDIGLMYSLSDQVIPVTESLINTFSSLSEKPQFSSYKRQLAGLSLETATNQELALVTEKLVESSNKLINSTVVALEESLKQGRGLSEQNKVMLENLEDMQSLFSDLETGLSRINESDLKGKNKLVSKIKENNNIIRSLVSKNNLVGTKQVKNILESVVSQLGIKEQEFARDHMEKAIQGQINDSNFIFSFFGQLHHASNPILNMIGIKVWEADMMANQYEKEMSAEFTNYMEEVGFTKEQFANMFDENGHLKGPYNTKKHLDDREAVMFKTYNDFVAEKIDTIEEYRKAKREQTLKLNELSELDFGNYKIALQERLLDVDEPIINPLYYKEIQEKYKSLNISPETVTFLKELSSSRAAIRNKARKEDGRVILSPQTKSELNDISKTRKTRKSIYSDITGLKKGLKIDYTKPKDGIELPTGGYLVLDLSETSNDIERTAAKIAYDLHRIDEDYIDNIVEKDDKSTKLKLALRELISSSNYSTQEKLDILLSNVNVALSKEFYETLGEESMLQNPELDANNPGREDDLKTLRELSAKKSALIAMNRNTSSPIEIDKMHEIDMEVVREYTLTINAILRTLKIPENENESAGVKAPNQAYKNYLKNKGITEGTAEELLELETSSHSNTSDISKVVNAYNKSEAGMTLSESEENLMEKHKGDTLLETKLNYAKSNLYAYFTRFAPEGYKTIKERFNAGEKILSIFTNMNSDPYINIVVDNSLLDDSEVVRMDTFSEISGQIFERQVDSNNNIIKTKLEDFLEKEKNGDLITLTNSQNTKYKKDLYNNGYILNLDYNKDYKGGFSQPKKGKYENKEYSNYFALNKKGEATKNKDEFEVRRLYLETKEKAFKNMDSQGQDLYKPVQISKTTTEKIRAIIGSNATMQEKWSAIIEIFKERLAYRIDDLAYGEKDFKKSKLLPKYYTRDLEDPNDVSDDHFMALTQLIAKSSQYKAKKEVLSDIESLQNILLNNKRHSRGKKLENVLKMTESFVDSAIYGKTEQLTKKFVIPGSKFELDLAKVARSFTKYVSIKNLGFSLPIAVTGLTTGYITKKVEDFVGEKTNRESAKLAFKEYKTLMGEAASNTLKAKVVDNSKLTLIGQAFNEYDMTAKTRNAKFGPFQRLFSKSAMAIHAAADFPITPQVMLSILFDNRIVDGKRYNMTQFIQEKTRDGMDKKVAEALWKNEEGKAVYNYMNFTKDGFTWENTIYNEFPNKSKEEVDKYLLEAKRFINTSMANQLSVIKGQIPQNMRVTAQRHAVGSMAMLHKGFASIILQNKFKDRHLNFDTGLYEEGHYRTLGRLMSSIIGNPMKMMERKEDFQKFYKEPQRSDFKDSSKTDAENNADFNEAWLDYELKVRNTKRVVKEMGVYLSMVLIFSMVFAAAEDDDNEDIYMIGLTNYILRRTLNEASTNLSTGIVGDAISTLESPLVTLRSAQDFSAMWELFDGEEISANKYKGLSKRQRYLVKNIPGAKAIYDMHDAETLQEVTNSYKMYNKGITDSAVLQMQDFFTGK